MLSSCRETAFHRHLIQPPLRCRSIRRLFCIRWPLFRTKNPVRDDLSEKEWVWGITVGEVAKAYPLDRLEDGQPIRDTVNGLELELVLDAAARSVAVTVVETGEPLDNGVGSFWFSWQDFFRDTLVFQ